MATTALPKTWKPLSGTLGVAGSTTVEVLPRSVDLRSAPLSNHHSVPSADSIGSCVSVAWLQVAPPSAVARIRPFIDITSVPAPASCSEAPVIGGCAVGCSVQRAPPSVVRSSAPASPAAQPLLASEKRIVVSRVVRPEACLVQLPPPSRVRRISPLSPTDQPLLASMKKKAAGTVPVGRGACQHQPAPSAPVQLRPCTWVRLLTDTVHFTSLEAPAALETFSVTA